jgi:hypothetical protein
VKGWCAVGTARSPTMRSGLATVLRPADSPCHAHQPLTRHIGCAVTAQGVRHSPRAKAGANAPRPARLSATRVPGRQGRVDPPGSTNFPVARTITTHDEDSRPPSADQAAGRGGAALEHRAAVEATGTM